MTTDQIKCRQCGEGFEAQRSTRKWCSDYCRVTGNRARKRRNARSTLLRHLKKKWQKAADKERDYTRGLRDCGNSDYKRHQAVISKNINEQFVKRWRREVRAAAAKHKVDMAVIERSLDKS